MLPTVKEPIPRAEEFTILNEPIGELGPELAIVLNEFKGLVAEIFPPPTNATPLEPAEITPEIVIPPTPPIVAAVPMVNEPDIDPLEELLELVREPIVEDPPLSITVLAIE